MHFGGLLADPETWVAIAFVIFAALFGKRLWTALAGMLDKRADAVRAELAEAARLRQEAEAMLADARSRREQALVDARHMLEGATAEAARLGEAAAAEAQAAAARRERMALDRIAAAEKAAVTQVRLAATEIAIEAAGHIIESGIDAGADAALVDTAIAGMPQALSRRIA